MVRWIWIILTALFPCLANACPLDLPEKEQQALMDKHLFPLLQEADRVVIYSLYPVPKENLKKEIWMLCSTQRERLGCLTRSIR